jgi:hypothetical protein
MLDTLCTGRGTLLKISHQQIFPFNLDPEVLIFEMDRFMHLMFKNAYLFLLTEFLAQE